MVTRTEAEVAGHPAELTERLLLATHLSIWEAFRRSAARWPTRPAIAGRGQAITYGELADRVLTCAANLVELGVGAGTRVAYILPMSSDWAILHYALLRVGAVVVPLNPSYEAAELTDVVGRSKAEVLVAAETIRGAACGERLRRVDPSLIDGATAVEALPSLRRVVILPASGDGLDRSSARHHELFGARVRALGGFGPVTGGDPALILFTSGSTARPKPTLLSNGGLVGAATALSFSVGVTEHDRVMAYAPNFHVGGTVWALLMAHLCGAAAYVMPFDPDEILRTIDAEKITVFNGMDTHFTKLMASPLFPGSDVSSVVKGNVGCTSSFMRRIEQEFSFERIVQIFGSTESLGVLAITPRDETDIDAIRETNGKPVPGMDVAIIDPATGSRVPAGTPGEICFRGWGRYMAYIDPPEEQPIDDDGYFHSGDYGWLDAAGNLYFRGRYKQMVRTGGENVAEREVEIFLESNIPEIRHAEVVGVPDDVWGEAIVAFVELAPTASLHPDELRERCRGKIAPFKIPKHFLVIDPDEGWPMLGSGRTDKPRLRARARAAVTGEGLEEGYSARHPVQRHE